MVSRQGNSRRAREARSESVSSYIGKGIVTPGQGGGVAPPGYRFLSIGSLPTILRIGADTSAPRILISTGA